MTDEPVDFAAILVLAKAKLVKEHDSQKHLLYNYSNHVSVGWQGACGSPVGVCGCHANNRVTIRSP